MSSYFERIPQSDKLALPVRRAFIEISDPSEDDKPKKEKFRRLEGLNVRFDIKRSITGIMPSATIAVCNLAQYDLQYLVNFFGTKGAWSAGNYRIIRLFAGYGKNVRLLFQGYVYKFSASMPPDIWLTFECISCFNINTAQVSFSLNDTCSLQRICEIVAEQISLKLDYRATTDKTFLNPSFDGNGYDAVDYLRGLDEERTKISVTPDRLEVTDLSEQSDRKWIISPQTGLIGTPVFEPTGMTSFITLLNPDAQSADLVSLRSIIVNCPYKEHKVWTLRHFGELRGNGFFTEWYAAPVHSSKEE